MSQPPDPQTHEHFGSHACPTGDAAPQASVGLDASLEGTPQATPPLDEAAFLDDPAAPQWVRDVFRFLPVKSQFILSGNIRDRFPWPTTGSHRPLPITTYVAEALSLRGYEYFLAFDTVDGFTVVTPGYRSESEARDFFSRTFGLRFDERGRAPASFEKALDIIERITAHRSHFVAILLDFASRYAVRLSSLSDQEHLFFTRALKLSHRVVPHTTAARPNEALFNSVIWLCEAANDLPDWLAVGNPRLRAITVPDPDHIIRRALVEAVSPGIPGHGNLADDVLRQRQREFIELTNGLDVNDLLAIVQLCRREGISLSDIGEAVRRYKLGVIEDPWKRLDRERVATGVEFIGQRVKGQRQAIVKALDIIKRAVTGLSAPSGGPGGKPRGVMFLAGPTGVGKTELAKALTELLFGDESAYIRFDMSEFSAQHADQRLLGAPPGYVGYDAGGELTNAIRERPFSVVLFDEIEKAHPRLLDKFLQLLDDGVLTSGRGERCYFSEAVIIFTSNLGVYRVEDDGRRVPNVTAADDYDTVQRKLRREISDHFKTELNRPELLNRIGENIVVFDFIREDIAGQIFEKMVSGILDRLLREQDITISFSAEALATLRRVCLDDLSNGGRGIGNQIEAWLINPLARALFDHDVQRGSALAIAQICVAEGVPSIAFG